MDVEGAVACVTVHGERPAQAGRRPHVVGPVLAVVEADAGDVRVHGAAGLAVELHGGRLRGEGEAVAALGHRRVLGDLEVERSRTGGLEPHGVVGTGGRGGLDVVVGHLGRAGCVAEHLDIVRGPGILEVTMGLTGDFPQVEGEVCRDPALGRALEEQRVRSVAEHHVNALGLGPVHIEVVVVRGRAGVRQSVIAPERGARRGACLARCSEELDVRDAGRDVAGNLVDGSVLVAAACLEAGEEGRGVELGGRAVEGRRGHAEVDLGQARDVDVEAVADGDPLEFRDRDVLAHQHHTARRRAGDDVVGRVVEVGVDRVLQRPDQGDVERHVDARKALGPLEHLDITAHVLVGMGEDGRVGRVTEELEGARVEAGGPDIVAVGSMVEADALDVRWDRPRDLGGEGLDLGAAGGGEGVAALHVGAVHRCLDVERPSRVLEEDGIVWARSVGGVDGRGTDGGGARRYIVDLDDVVITALEVRVRVTGEASDIECDVRGERFPALEHLGITAHIREGVDLDRGVCDVAEEAIGARREGGGPRVVAIGGIVEAYPEHVSMDGTGDLGGEWLDLCAVGRGEGVAALGVRTVDGRLDVERSSRVLEEDGVVRARGIRGIDGRRADG